MLLFRQNFKLTHYRVAVQYEAGQRVVSFALVLSRAVYAGAKRAIGHTPGVGLPR